MRSHGLILVLAIIAGFSVSAAASIDDNGLKCWTFGATCATDGTIVAGSNGAVTGNLYYASANFTDYVRVIDTNPANAWTSPWMLDNQLGVGQPLVDFGNALKGDILVVQLCDQQEQPNICNSTSKNEYLFGSDPRYSADGLSHAMIAQNGGAGPLANGGGLRSQLIWLEDLSNKQNSDWDFNDLVLAMHNVDVLFPHSAGLDSAPVPEPATLSLLAGGLLAGLIGRIKRN